MGGLQPFSPDDQYCVYCHAPAAGLCAGCQAICCGDCVELVMGVTKQCAVCQSCIEKGWSAPGKRPLTLLAALLGAAVMLGLFALYFAT